MTYIHIPRNHRTSGRTTWVWNHQRPVVCAHRYTALRSRVLIIPTENSPSSVGDLIPPTRRCPNPETRPPSSDLGLISAAQPTNRTVTFFPTTGRSRGADKRVTLQAGDLQVDPRDLKHGCFSGCCWSVPSLLQPYHVLNSIVSFPPCVVPINAKDRQKA